MSVEVREEVVVDLECGSLLDMTIGDGYSDLFGNSFRGERKY